MIVTSLLKEAYSQLLQEFGINPSTQLAQVKGELAADIEKADRAGIISRKNGKIKILKPLEFQKLIGNYPGKIKELQQQVEPIIQDLNEIRIRTSEQLVIELLDELCDGHLKHPMTVLALPEILPNWHMKLFYKPRRDKYLKKLNLSEPQYKEIYKKLLILKKATEKEWAGENWEDIQGNLNEIRIQTEKIYVDHSNEIFKIVGAPMLGFKGEKQLNEDEIIEFVTTSKFAPIIKRIYDYYNFNDEWTLEDFIGNIIIEGDFTKPLKEIYFYYSGDASVFIYDEINKFNDPEDIKGFHEITKKLNEIRIDTRPPALKIGNKKINPSTRGEIRNYSWEEGQKLLSKRTLKNAEILFLKILGITPTKVQIEHPDNARTSYYITGIYNGEPIILARREVPEGIGQTKIMSKKASIKTISDTTGWRREHPGGSSYDFEKKKSVELGPYTSFQPLSTKDELLKRLKIPQ